MHDHDHGGNDINGPDDFDDRTVIHHGDNGAIYFLRAGRVLVGAERDAALDRLLDAINAERAARPPGVERDGAAAAPVRADVLRRLRDDFTDAFAVRYSGGRSVTGHELAAAAERLAAALGAAPHRSQH